MQALVADRKLLAYHDRSDGGLFVTLAEMAFAGKTGISVQLDQLASDDLSVLFNEELGALVQVRSADVADIIQPAAHFRPAHRIVHEAILDLQGRGQPVDAVTVADYLQATEQLTKIGGAAYLHTLIASVPTAAIATGDFLMKCDAHCMFQEGYDEILKADCPDDGVLVPRRRGNGAIPAEG